MSVGDLPCHCGRSPSGWCNGSCSSWGYVPVVIGHTPVEVCPECDIAGCHHIRERQATPTGWQCPGCKTYHAPQVMRCECAKEAK